MRRSYIIGLMDIENDYDDERTGKKTTESNPTMREVGCKCIVKYLI
jgi:hypothetical protein